MGRSSDILSRWTASAEALLRWLGAKTPRKAASVGALWAAASFFPFFASGIPNREPDSPLGERRSIELPPLSDDSEEMARMLEKEVEAFADSEPLRALKSLEKAIELNQKSKGSAVPAKLNDLAENYLWSGILHRKLGTIDQADKDFHQALKLSLQAGHRRNQAEALNHLGVLRRERSDFAGARQLYEQALARLEGVDGSYQLELQLLRNLAGIFRIENNRVQSGSTLQAASELARRAGDMAGRAQIQLDLGYERQLAKDYEGALEAYWEIFDAVDLLRASDRIVLFDRLASTLASLRKPDRAWLAAQHALDIARRSGEFTYEMRLWAHRCQLTVQFPDLDRPSASGRPYCQDAELQIRDLRDSNQRAAFLGFKAARLQQLGKLPEAIAAAEEAVALADSLRSRVPGPSGRSRFLESRSDLFRQLADLLMEAHLRDPLAGNDLKALQVGERLKARGVLDMWSAAGVDFLSRASARERAEIESVRNELDELELARGNRDNDNRIALLAEKLDLFGDKLARTGHIRDWKSSSYFSLDQIQKKLGAGTAILVLLHGKNKSYLFVIQNRGRIRSFELGSPERLDEAAEDFLGRLANPQAVAAPEAIDLAGRQLAVLLWGAREERLAGLPERLVFVGDGKLQSLPLHPLPRLGSGRGSPQQQLIDTHEVVHLPSLSLIPQWEERERALGKPTRNGIVFGDPFYQLANHSPGSVVPLSPEELRRHFGPQGGNLPIGRLSAADREVASIRSHFGTRALDFLLGPKASRIAALAPNVGTYSIVHFASHGQVDNLHGGLSALLLSEVDPQGKKIDGRLRLQDLYEVSDWRADLVVASACQTGVGENLRLEGAGGIGQGFLQIGARRAVLSLWPVETESTAFLMDRLYFHLAAGLAPGSALRAASLDLRKLAKAKGTLWGSPFYWSPFILIGDWTSFVLPA